MRNKGRFLLVCVGVICLVSACLLSYYNIYEDQAAGDAVRPVVATLDVVAAEARENEERIIEAAELPVVPNYEVDPNREMPEKEVDGHLYIGTLRIPALELELPVISQWNYRELKKAPCRYFGSVYTNDLIIAAHNYRSHFGNLYKLVSGDQVLFTDMEGNEFVYEVDNIETIGKYQVEDMEAGDWDLTLFTCTVGGENRVTVRCRVVA